MLSVMSGRVHRVLRVTAAGLVLALLVAAVPRPARAGDAEGIAGGVASGIFVGLMCWAFAIPRGAEEPSDNEFERRGAFVRVQGSNNWQNFEDRPAGLMFGGDPLPAPTFFQDQSWGVRAGGGYRCHPRLSGDIQVEWINGYDADLTVMGSKFARVDVDPIVITSNFKGYFLTGRFQPFVLLGGGVMTTSARLRSFPEEGTDQTIGLTDFALRAGGGLDVYATKNIVVSVEADYVFPVGDLKGFDYVSLGWGVEYRF